MWIFNSGQIVDGHSRKSVLYSKHRKARTQPISIPAAVFIPTTMRYDEFYHTSRWVKKRARILRRDKYQCQIAKRYGRLEEANTVHHIFPRKKYPQYTWEDWNLISVSAENHNRLENRATGELTEEGLALMEATAKKRGIKLHMKVLVIGLPGSGKTTYARQHLGDDGLCYDLDALAAAFRLTDPKAERHSAARRMANDLLMGFADNADIYSPVVYVIRTAPTQTEIEAIEPDEVVRMTKVYQDRHLSAASVAEMKEKIEQAAAYVRAKKIPLIEI